MEDIEIKVVTINNRYHARLYKGEKVLDEMACEHKEDIGYICRTMLRWYDKMGGNSTFAKQARKRLNAQNCFPIGKIWYKNKLDEEKDKK